jgi:hypothetical protein
VELTFRFPFGVRIKNLGLVILPQIQRTTKASVILPVLARRLPLSEIEKEGRTMAAKILVPLKRNDRVEEILPYIEKVAQPGASIVFLVHHPVNSFKWLKAYCGIAQCGLEKTLTVRRMIESYSLKTRRQLAQRRVFRTCEALHDMDLNITVDVYTGSLRKTLKSYADIGDAQLLVMQPGFGQRIMSALHGTVFVSSVFSRSFSSSALLLHSGK